MKNTKKDKIKQDEVQPVSLSVWDMKYRLKDSYGNAIEEDMDKTLQRVARSLAKVEKNNKSKWNELFLWAMRNGALPAGRILSNAGADKYKPATSTINCTVSQTVDDSMESILNAVKAAGVTLKYGCGIGYEFSKLRPSGSFVQGAGATTSGPLSFMDIFDKTCFTISSAGGRRGAQMATFDVSHPDIEAFIEAKREDGRLRQFNLSCLITKDFMQAVENDESWDLCFPCIKGDNDEDNNTGKTWIVYKKGIKYKVYKTIKARDLWDKIMKSAYDYAEPGFLLIDRVNQQNNNWFCEDIRATNPCGEQALPPNGSCLLGSINLTKFVENPFAENAYFDFDKYRKVIRIFTRMLDNVVEVNGLPLKEQRREILNKRRHGMGYLGIGSSLAMLGIKYGTKDAVAFTGDVSKILAIEGWKEGINLAKEKGSAPIMDEEFSINSDIMNKIENIHGKDSEYYKKLSKYKDENKKLKGKELLVMSGYMDFIRNNCGEGPDIIKDIVKYGCRFTHHTSIAPTGTIALSYGNNCSNGIEPSFSHEYIRNIIIEGKKTKKNEKVYSYEYLLYKNIIKDKDINIDNLPDYFVTTDDINPKQHVDMQAAAQKWIDSSISKTINIPTDYDYDKFQDIYLYGYKKGLKGCTVFRFNPDAFQGVLVKEKDLENTTYTFTTEKDVFKAKGNDLIEYDGETHTAANLYDAIKEKTYGKW